MATENGNDMSRNAVGNQLPTYCVTSQESGELTFRLISEGPLNNAAQGHNESH